MSRQRSGVLRLIIGVKVDISDTEADHGKSTGEDRQANANQGKASG